MGAVIVGPDGRVLLIRRGRAPGRGSWTLPGGKLEPGETPAQAIAREVREETGLYVSVEAELGVVPVTGEGFAYDVREHLCFPEDALAAPRPGDDADEARWVPVDDLEAMGVSPAARDVVRLALARARGHR